MDSNGWFLNTIPLSGWLFGIAFMMFFIIFFEGKKS